MDEYTSNIKATEVSAIENVGARRAFTDSRRFKICLLALAACTALIGVFIINGIKFAVSVSVGGVPLGFAKNVNVLESSINAAEAKASEILGHEYDLAPLVSHSARIKSSEVLLDEKALCNALLESVPEIGLYYVVSVGDSPLGALSSGEGILRVREQVFDEYRTENTISIEFDSPLSFTRDFFPVSESLSEEELYGALKGLIAEGKLRVVSVCTESVEESIVHETEIVPNELLALGESAVVSEGRDGAVLRTVERQYINGEAGEYEIIDSEITANSETEIVEIGVSMKGVPTGTFIWPTNGIVTSYFGYRSVAVGSSFHKGIDIGTGTGTDIIAADGGTVIYADQLSGYGNLVEISHGNGVVTRYAHCSRILVSEGDTVGQGELIAYVGSSGISSGPHLHFEVRVDGEARDPLSYLG